MSWVHDLLAGFKPKIGSSQRRRRGNSASRVHHRLLRMEWLEDRSLLTITVNTLADENNFLNVGGRSLREAINEAAPGELINFEAGLNGTITLIHGELPTISQNQTIDATGHNITIDANDPTPGIRDGQGTRIFNIADLTGGAAPPLVTLKGLRLTGGDVNLFAGSPEGGAIRSTGMLAVEDCTLTGNYGRGMWVNVAGTGQRDVLTVVDSVIEGNGGGIAVTAGSNIVPTIDRIAISGSTITGNTGGFSGGGVYANLYGASLTLESSTISLNGRGPVGGGIQAKLQSGASLTITGCDVSQNEASSATGVSDVSATYAATLMVVILNNVRRNAHRAHSRSSISGGLRFVS